MSSFLKDPSWGKYPKIDQEISFPYSLSDLESFVNDSSQDLFLPYGLGRSYGDSCTNKLGTLVSSKNHDHFLSFNDDTGVLKAQSGVSLEDIITYCMPRGWFLPVTPGTKYVSLGGALANDVHGKNHHKMGNFGRHILSFRLIKSSGEAFLCSKSQNTELFQASIGGMGLTGIIDWVEIQLISCKNSYFDVECIKFGNLEEFFALEKESQNSYDYTVAWIDGLAKDSHQGRGLFLRGNANQELRDYKGHSSKLSIPFNFPSIALNPISVKAFNFLYYNKQFSKTKKIVSHYDPFFYPLDAIRNWNRIYGTRGFVQYQFVIPFEGVHKNMKIIMDKIAANASASFLTVLKSFGELKSPGMMSFPRKGLTYALDFPVSTKNFQLLTELDQIILSAGGAIYPAKDARMSKEMFHASFPRWEEFSKFIDPKIQSDFWLRMNT